MLAPLGFANRSAAADSDDSSLAGIHAAVDLLELMLTLGPDSAQGPLDGIRDKVADQSLSAAQRAALLKRLTPILQPLLDGDSDQPLSRSALLLAGNLGLPKALPRLQSVALDANQAMEFRRQCVACWTRYDAADVLPEIDRLVDQFPEAIELHEACVDVVAGLDKTDVAPRLLALHKRIAAAARVRVVDTLSSKASWAHALLDAIESNQLSKTDLGGNQAMRIVALGDEPLKQQLNRVWGAVRTGRDPARQQVIQRVQQLLANHAGDPNRGQEVFRRVCAQCHRMHGVGHEVGPDITRNGRGNFEQLVSNVLDPNLVIGAGFVSRTVLTFDGRVVSGIVLQDSQEQLVLKLQGGRSETIAKDDIDSESQTGLSLMPEGLETQMTNQELVDLFALLTLESPPGTSGNRIIAGTPKPLHESKRSVP